MDTARHDFATLAEDVEHHRFLVKGAALLAKDADGKPRVLEIGNHLGRKGAGLGAGIGILLGLFAPPFLGSLVLGAATGALFAGFASHELKIGLEHEIGRALAAGTCAVVVILSPSSLMPAERDLRGAESKSINRLDKSTITSLEKEIERALHEHAAQAGLEPSPDSVGTNS